MQNTKINLEKAIELAGNYFGQEYHCAEAVAKATLEALGQESEASVACATPFGGGFGKTHQEVCGALSGALIAIGQMHGRKAPGQDWTETADLGAAVREAFLARYATTHCQTLRLRFGEEAQMDECRKIVRLVTQDVLESLILYSRQGLALV
ncbi:C-GCAxxG-C-C family protein [Desulfovibrio ferrophilus]|uniref:C_GCAxxG_C_C family protein n=1 Tax=Desulfovibrio ferrophilus TaxID=241368 RepID=A0A2Z6B3F9_9BACT|nr:C-GCAxxG-C-C family protein [Desulfovibrio ferrophilus]BBD09993.1 C_GCAxxG_C_C family protein [Desulfovibrio ferrophilus]